MPYHLVLSENAKNHLRELSARHRAIVAHGIEVQLLQQPTLETRNRKRMEPNDVAPWELRLGDLRVYYGVVEEPGTDGFHRGHRNQKAEPRMGWKGRVEVLMKTIDVSKTLAPLSEQLSSLGSEPVILTRRRKPIGVWFPVTNADLETVSLSFNPKFMAIIDESRRQIKEGKVFTLEEICREFGIPAVRNRKRQNSKKNGKAKAAAK